MALPTPADVRAELEGYGITSAVLSDAWIIRRRDKIIVPWIEEKCRIVVAGGFPETQFDDEYYSGTGSTILTLRRRFITSLVEIELVINNVTETVIAISSIDVISKEGILKSRRNFEDTAIHPLFPKGSKNIRITYKTQVPAEDQGDFEEAILYLMCEKALGQIASRTGGGDISVKEYSRSYGKRGKYTHARNDFARDAMALLKPFMTGIVGQ